jgi:hypothetical protein
VAIAPRSQRLRRFWTDGRRAQPGLDAALDADPDVLGHPRPDRRCVEVSHAGLDALAPRAPQAVGFVRAQLVGCRVLPARDEPSAAFAAWHSRALEQIEPGKDRAHVRAYATWQVAHQLARTSQSGRPTVSAQKYARSLVSEAIKLTCRLHAQQLELRDLRQDLLDTWIADGPGIRRRARGPASWGRPLRECEDRLALANTDGLGVLEQIGA